MEEQYYNIKLDIEQMLRTISEEVELIRQDNLARGKLIQSVPIYASRETTSSGDYWSIKQDRLRTPVLQSDPTEYWGDLGFAAQEDFIAGTPQYPWMPQRISESDTIPF